MSRGRCWPEVGATEVPSLLVLNKRDRLAPDELAALKAEYPDAIVLSTRSKDDLQALRERIMGYFESDMLDEELRIPFTAQGGRRRDPRQDAYPVRRL
jgi:GTP-binding protein HflX